MNKANALARIKYFFILLIVFKYLQGFENLTGNRYFQSQQFIRLMRC